MQCREDYHASIGRSVTDFTVVRSLLFAAIACGSSWPILLQKSGLKVVRGVLGFLGRAGTMVLHQAAAELQD
jgi:hypothetical protein